MTQPEASTAGPAPPDRPVPPPLAAAPARIVALDLLRGFAVLGILVMNIQSFSMIFAAYMNPTAFGDFSGINRWVWIVSHVLADQKFMTLFSLLFGAGIALMTSKAEATGRHLARAHYQRMGWLLLLGLAHAYLLWFGDILVTYALCGMVAFWFRRLRPGWLLTWGLLALSLPSLINLVAGLSLPFWPPDLLDALRHDWIPDAEHVAWELAVYRGSWLEQMTHRVPTAASFQTFVFAIWGGWRAGGLMLVGMALLKWGVLSAERSNRFYAGLLAAGLTLGLPVIVLGLRYNFAANWSIERSMFQGAQHNYWGSLPMALAYLALVMLFVKHRWLQGLQSSLTSVGQMALTNYLGQTLICTTLFYGHGLGWFGHVDRWQQLGLVFAVWLVLIAFSNAWLRLFRQGPMEWLWRSLTYRRREPLLRSSGVSSSP
jgi:uncharacterized protein